MGKTMGESRINLAKTFHCDGVESDNSGIKRRKMMKSNLFGRHTAAEVGC